MNTTGQLPDTRGFQQEPQVSVERQITEAMREKGLNPPSPIHIDGKYHRFPTNENRQDTAGWYIFDSDPIAAGAFGDWRTDCSHSFKAIVRQEYPEIKIADSAAKTKESIRKQEIALVQKHREASALALKNWESTPLASENHPYLKKKKVLPHGLHIDGEGKLILPLYDSEETIVSLQYIDENGKKKFQYGGQTKSAYFSFQEIDPSKQIVVAEGFATGASILERAGEQVVIAFSANNLEPVTGILRNKYPSTKIIICADNDENETGQKAAQKAAKAHQASIVMPPRVGTDANDYANQGGDLKALFSVRRKKGLVSYSEFMKQSAPIGWLIDGWLPEHALVMLHGPSGSGKTLVALDWMLTVSTGIGQWMGCKATQGDVIFLCGEGHNGIKTRIKAWAFEHGKSPDDSLCITEEASVLDEPSQLRITIQNIQEKSKKPKLIVIDTLFRFFSKDENSAKDARDFLEACTALMDEFDCTVVIVHHTGWGQEAQNRGRGSSAWKGALDVEIGIRPIATSGLVLQQVKARDTEVTKPLKLKIKSLQFPGWTDQEAQVNGAVIVEDDQSTSPLSGQPTKDIEALVQAWEMAGGEIVEGFPFITFGGWKRLLMTKHNLTENSAKQALKVDPKRMVGRLVTQQIIRKHRDGFLVIDSRLAERLQGDSRKE
jgi:putative DNA primase/helicase